MEKAQKIFGVIILLCSFSVTAELRINKIKYQGNEVSQPLMLNREIYIHEGDEFDEALVEKSRQAIMDLGLFKTVHLVLEKNKSNDTVDVVFVVKEKYYLLVLPRLKVEDNEFFYGVQLKWDNIMGLNHRVRALAEDRGSTNGVNESRYSFRYSYPNINNKYYNLDFELQSSNEVDEVDGVVDRQDDVFRLALSKWLNKTGRNRGWFAGGSVLYQQRNNEDLINFENSDSVKAIVLGVDIGYRNLNNFEYNRGGKFYGYKLGWSDDTLGSETKFTKHLLFYTSYYRFDRLPYSNLNVQVKLGHSNNKILGESAFSLGSSDDLRGYENNRFNGNTLFVTNIEFMYPHPEKPVFRYVTFVDVGNTYDKLSGILHEPLNVGAGFGIRWKIKSLVNIDLRADVGYGFTDEDYKFSFGTRHAF